MNIHRLLLAIAVGGSILACSLVPAVSPAQPPVETIVVATLQAATAPGAAAPTSAPTPLAPAGMQVSFPGGSLAIPPGLASGIASENVPAVDTQNGAPWDVAPAYVKVTLRDYVLQGKFFQPQIMIYPAQEYAAVSQGAAMSIQRLQAILASPAAPMGKDVLPHLPYANADQIIAAQTQLFSFKSGQGVRVLTEYAQYVAPINNHDLFYHFEGLTRDGKFYVVAILPINASFLAPESDPASPVPPGGVPFPGSGVTDPAVFESYYQGITDKLNTTSPDAFQPNLTSLDALIGSLEVSQ